MSEAAPQQRRWPSSIWHTSLQSPPTCITSTHWQTTLKSHKKDACNCFSYCSTCLIYSGLNTYEYTTISCFALAMGSNSLQIDHLFLAFPKFPENRFTASYYFLLVFFTALSMIGCWHDNVLCLSVRLWCCAVWLNDTSHTAKVSEQVNRKCHPRSTILQLSTIYTNPIPSSSPPHAPQTLVPSGKYIKTYSGLCYLYTCFLLKSNFTISFCCKICTNWLPVFILSFPPPRNTSAISRHTTSSPNFTNKNV